MAQKVRRNTGSRTSGSRTKSSSKPSGGGRRSTGSKAKPIAAGAFSGLLRAIRPDVDERLDALLRAELETHGSLGSEVKTILNEANALSLRGGKRLRAALVVAGQRAFGKPSGRQWSKRERDLALEAGVALELLQSYFLIHDDWMDQDAERRGGPTVHHALAESFGSQHAAASGAILAGDFLVALATRHLTHTARKQANLAALLGCFSEMQIAAVLGQQLDVIGQTKDAQLIYRLKTGSYTVNGPLQLGALIGGASARRTEQIRQFADPVGIAFQMRDDLLSLFGDPSKTGKPYASDLRSGKWTWVVQYALNHGSPQQKKSLRACLGNPKAKQSQLKVAITALEQSGALTATEQRIAELSEQAQEALSKMRLSAESRDLLLTAMNALIDRRM